MSKSEVSAMIITWKIPNSVISHDHVNDLNDAS